MKRTALALAAVALFLTAGCNVVGEGGSDAAAVTITGTVDYLEIEGGHWTLVESDSSRYVPLSLPEAFRSDGLPVEARAVLRENRVSVCQCGPVVELKSIERR